MVNWIKKKAAIFTNFIVEPINKAVTIVVIGTISYILYHNLGYEKFLELSKVWAWRIFLVLIVFNFKKVIAYLFFSLDEFSFFGTKGKLKDIRALIDEKVQKRFEEVAENNERNLQIETLKQDLETNQENTDVLLKIANDAVKKMTEYSNELQERDRRIQELTNINSNLVNNVTTDSFENSQPRTGALVNKDGTVYFVGIDKLMVVPDLLTFNSWGFSFAQVQPINGAERLLPLGDPMPKKLGNYSSPLEQIISEAK
jgi:hypothetical protein